MLCSGNRHAHCLAAQQPSRGPIFKAHIHQGQQQQCLDMASRRSDELRQGKAVFLGCFVVDSLLSFRLSRSPAMAIAMRTAWPLNNQAAVQSSRPIFTKVSSSNA
jgi:hypothetical protein